MCKTNEDNEDLLEEDMSKEVVLSNWSHRSSAICHLMDSLYCTTPVSAVVLYMAI
jgi:hypothetical protein